jgi:hypothetical protein
MAGFWYFFPDAQREALVAGDLLRLDFLRAVGLDGVLADVRAVPDHAVVHAVTGGVLVYPVPVSGDVPRHVGAMDRLAWRTVKAGGRSYRIGWDPTEPPGPATLERRELVGGYTVKDALGRPWNVPVLRSVANPRGRLGVSFSWDDDDVPQVGVERRYAEIWERSGRVWDLIDHNTDGDVAFLAQSFTADEDRFLLEYVLDCLAINYRVGRRVWGTLDRVTPDWLSQGIASVMLDATLDLWKYRAFLEAQKKSAS